MAKSFKSKFTDPRPHRDNRGCERGLGGIMESYLGYGSEHFVGGVAASSPCPCDPVTANPSGQQSSQRDCTEFPNIGVSDLAFMILHRNLSSFHFSSCSLFVLV